MIEIDVDKSDLTDFTKAVTRFKELPPNILDVMYISVKGIRNSPGITFMKNNNKYWKFIGQVGQELVESIYRFQRYKPLHLANYKFHFKNTKSIADGTLNLGWRGWEGAFPTTVTSTCPNGTKRKTVAFYDDAVKTSEKRLVPLLSYFHEDKSSNKFAGTALTGIQAYLGNSLSPLSETIWFTDYARKDNESSYTEGVLAYVKINNGEKASPFSPVKIDHHFSNEHAFFVSLGANKEKSKLFLGAYHSASVTDYRRGSVYEIIPSHN